MTIKSIIEKSIILLMNLLSPKEIFEIIPKFIDIEVQKMKGDEAAFLLFELDNKLYCLQSRVVMEANNGLHPKHKILKYKEWFRDQITAGDVVLDIGSNTGLLPQTLAEKASYVYGIEMVSHFHEEAKSTVNSKNIKFILGDATKYDFSNCKPIDCITMSNVLEHVENRVEFLKKIVLNVKWKSDQKRIIFRVPVFDRDWRTPLKKEMGCEWRLDQTHFTEYTRESFYKELDSAGIFIETYDVRFGEIYATGIVDCEGVSS